MKKTVKTLLIALCICLFNMNIAFAAGATASMDVDKESVKAGESIQVTINANCEEGLSAVVAEIEYDENVLTLEKVEAADKWVNYGEGAKLELLINSASKVTELDVCKLTFKVNDNASEGTTKIGTSKMEITDISSNTNTVENIEKTINIAKEGTPGGEQPPAQAEKTLSSIEITKAPTKTTYTKGEKFDKTGMIVTAKYSDGSSKVVTNYTYSPESELKLTDTKITVSYTEEEITKTAVLKIEVKEKQNNSENGGTTGGDKKDNTVSDKKYPNTGVEKFVMPIVIVAILGTISFIEYKKNKNI